MLSSVLTSSKRSSDARRFRRNYRRPSEFHHHLQPTTDVFIPRSLDVDDETIAELVRARKNVYADGDPDQYLETKRDRQLRDVRNVCICVVPYTDENDVVGIDDKTMQVDGDEEKDFDRRLQEFDSPADEEKQEDPEPHDPESQATTVILDDDVSFDSSEDFENSGPRTSGNHLPPSLTDRPHSAPELTQNMLDEIEAIYASCNDNIIRCQDSRLQKDLTKSALDTLRGQEWLDDSIIDYYLMMICARSNNQGLTQNMYPRVYSFYACFYSFLAVKDYNAVKGTAEGDNIFHYDLIFFPVCAGDHWRLIVADIKRWTLIIYNSMPITNDFDICGEIQEYLEREWRKIESHRFREMNIRIAENAPKQVSNGTECGVFTLQFAEYLSRNTAFDFNMNHMPYFRKKMMYECIMAHLLT